MRKIDNLLLRVGAAALLWAPTTQAQAHLPQPGVLLAVSKTVLPNGVRALVVRTANGAQQDLIVLASDANAEHTVPGAFALLRRLRMNEPVSATTQVHYITFSERRNALSARSHARYAAQLARARAGKHRDIKGVGEVTVIATSDGAK